MHASTPAGDSAVNVQNDLTPVERAELRDRVARLQLGLEQRLPAASPASLHGDIDRNGDIADELTQRLRSSIVATTPSLADAQLRAVRQVVCRVRP